MADDRRDLFEQLKASEHLPTLPHILLRIVDACNQEETSFKELSGIIEKDPALTSSILKMINSTHFGLPNNVVSLDQALVLLGMDAVKNVAISASIHQVFKPEEGPRGMDLRAFWRHSLLTALLARTLAQRIQYANPEEAFLTALLHDVGRLMLWVRDPKGYGELVERSGGSPERMLSEEKRMGALHSEVGAWLIRQWNLPSLMADAIQYHHEPLFRIVEAFPLVKIVYVSNILAKSEIPIEQRLEAAETVFGLSGEHTRTLLEAAAADLASAARFLDVDIHTEEPESQREEQTKKQQRLAHEVKNVSMLLGTLQSMLRTTNADDLVQVFYQALRLLFGLKDILVFRYDYERDLLVGRPAGREPAGGAAPLVIPYQDGEGLVVRSLKEAAVLSTFEGGLDKSAGDKRAGRKSAGGGDDQPAGQTSLADEEIMRLFGRSGLVCFPLIFRRSKVGVLVLASNERTAAAVLERRRRITVLTSHMAVALHTDNLRKIQLRQIRTERIEASSETAKRIVHEANNPLGIIRNYLAIAGGKLGEENPIADELRIIDGEVARISGLLDELSDFADQTRGEMKTTDVNGVIQDLIAVSKEPLLSHLTIRLNLEGSIPHLELPENRLKQIILNLIKNAAESMAEGGRLTVATKLLRRFPIEEIPEIEFGRTAGASYVQVTVEDTGGGIPETVRLHLFEPFVSTKGKEHQGIGLSVVYNTVRAMRGTITVRSRRGEGTRFTLLLPVTQAPNFASLSE